MSSNAKFLFDENFGGPIVDALKGLVAFQRDPPQVLGIREFIGAGTHDEVWVPRLGSEQWIVISADRGKQCGGVKLPDICVSYKVTHVLLSAPIHQLPQFDKMRAILSVWPRLCELALEPRGTRFRLRLSQDRSKAVLEPVVLKNDPATLPPDGSA